MAAPGSVPSTLRLKALRAVCWLTFAAAVTTLLALYPFSPLTRAMVSCFLLAVTYVASLYVWPNPLPRDHPSTIKRRFLSVSITTVLSPVFVFIFRQDVDRSTTTKVGVAELLGLRVQGLLAALLLPLLLTAVLFLGPLSLRLLHCSFRSYFGKRAPSSYFLLLDPRCWGRNVRDPVWLRNHVVAPLSEEFTFRACMLPLLCACLPYPAVILACPLFFGVAHLHHLAERLKEGTEVRLAIASTLFQFAYTTVFGAYSAFLFVRTGHLASAFAAHAFCNHMGFPELGEVMRHQSGTRNRLMAAFVLGLLAFCLLLLPLTDPALYANRAYRHLSE